MKVKKKRLKLKGGLILETHLHKNRLLYAYFLGKTQLTKFTGIGVKKLASKLHLPLESFAIHVGFDLSNPYTLAKLGLN